MGIRSIAGSACGFDFRAFNKLVPEEGVPLPFEGTAPAATGWPSGDDEESEKRLEISDGEIFPEAVRSSQHRAWLRSAAVSIYGAAGCIDFVRENVRSPDCPIVGIHEFVSLPQFVDEGFEYESLSKPEVLLEIDFTTYVQRRSLCDGIRQQSIGA